MAVYPAIYEARAVQINGRSLKAFIPQIFGDTPVTITRFTNAPPPSPSHGWVIFQSGNPEFPVWIGVTEADYIPPGVVTNDEMADMPPWTIKGQPSATAGPPQDVTPAQARSILANDAGASPGNKYLDGQGNWTTPAGAVDEVWVGATDPIGTSPTIELWYDTDAPASDLENAQRWNSAWGYVNGVRVNTDQAGFGTTYLPVSGTTVSFTGVAGRRYRVTAQAVLRQRVATGAAIFMLIWDVTAGVGLREVLNHVTSPDNYENFVLDYDWVPGAGVRQLQLQIKTTANTAETSGTSAGGTSLRIEDIGPVSQAVMQNPTPAWTDLTRVNGWVNHASRQPLQYRLVGDEVQIRGYALPGTTPHFATLPPACCPPAALEIPASGYNGSARILNSVTINTNGVLNADQVFGLGFTTSFWVS